jgi:hypothetical protein
MRALSNQNRKPVIESSLNNDQEEQSNASAPTATVEERKIGG